MRVGIGHDTHRLAIGGPLRLGGIDIPHDKHAVGHSDADILLHAITDALLGAAALGDIGMHFPDTDPRWKGAASSLFLEHARELSEKEGYAIVNVDCTVILERPKLKDHRSAIRESVAKCLRLDISRVNVK